MHTAQTMGQGSLGMAISNVSSIRQRLQMNDDNYREAEMLYALKSLIMEIDQYLGGGYFSFEYIAEKCQTMTRIAEGISREVLNRG